MALAGQISIDSNTLSTCISHLTNSKTSLENDAKTAITTGFAALEQCGLFSSGLAALKSSIDTLAASHDTVITSLSAHLTQMGEQENLIGEYFFTKSISIYGSSSIM